MKNRIKEVMLDEIKKFCNQNNCRKYIIRDITKYMSINFDTKLLPSPTSIRGFIKNTLKLN